MRKLAVSLFALMLVTLGSGCLMVIATDGHEGTVPGKHHHVVIDGTTYDIDVETGTAKPIDVDEAVHVETSGD